VRIKSTAKEDHQAAARVKVRVIHLKAEEGRPKSPSERVLKATRGLVKENQQAAHHAKQQTGPTIKKKQAQESHLPGVVQTEIKNSAAKEDHQAALHVKQEMTLMRNAVPDSEVQDDQPAMLMKGPLNVNPHVSHTANRNLVVTKKLPEVAENSHPTPYARKSEPTGRDADKRATRPSYRKETDERKPHYRKKIQQGAVGRKTITDPAQNIF
jgi:hypothetical protein